MNTSIQNKHQGILQGCSMAMLLLPPLLWPLDKAVTYMTTQILALCLLWFVFMQPSYLNQLGRAQQVLLAGIVLCVLLSLLPVPFSLWSALPGRAEYAEMIRLVYGNALPEWRQISMVPFASMQAFLALLPPILIYIVVRSMGEVAVRRLILWVVVIAVVQAMLGLIQYGSGIAGFSFLDRAQGNVATGTYLNRDHLAGFLAMTMPVVLALIAAMMGRHVNSHGSGHTRVRGSFVATLEGNQSLLYAAAATVIILCLIFTRSRMGIVLLMLGLVLALFAFSRRLGGTNVYGSYGTLIAVITVLAIEIGLAPVLDRFSQDPMQDMRWDIYATAMKGVADFFPLGSGIGTFPSVYPAYQVAEHDFFINHAHNDYLEWIFDGGLLALILIAAGLLLYLLQWRSVLAGSRWRTMQFIQVGVGIGLLLMLCHTFFDFNLHKPMNAIYFAFFLGVFMRPADE